MPAPPRMTPGDPNRAQHAGGAGNAAPAGTAVRRSRLIALGLAGLASVVIGIFVVAGLRGPPDSGAPAMPGMSMPGMSMPGMSMPGAAGGAGPAAAGTPQRFDGTLAGWRYQATLTSRPDRSFELVLRLFDQAGAPASEPLSPLLRLTMADHGMTMQPTPMERSGAGIFTARGQWSMSGRWRIDMLLSGAQAGIDVRIS